MSITFRRLGKLGDKTKLFEWANSDAVLPFMYRDHRIGTEEHEIWYMHARDDDNKFIVELDGEPVGFAQANIANAKNKRWAWGFYVAEPSACGKGVAKAIEFFMTAHVFGKGAAKIVIGIFADNEVVIGMHERFGYKREALFRKHIWKDGRWRDVVGMAMTSEEWEAKLRA